MESTIQTLSHIAHLTCSACGNNHSAFQPQLLSTCCQLPLESQYEIAEPLSKSILSARPATMWRYREMLPVFSDENIVSLGEGFTPILTLNNLARKYSLSNLQLKDEGQNPTGSFKARGLSMAISKAKEFETEGCIIPTAGNAGVAMAAYCAKAGMKAVVVMPRHTPKAFKEECYWYGADVQLVDGLINDCAARAKELNADGSLLDVSTLKEPYRLEGKKTMGYEIAEQLNWSLPDVILYPAGGGTGLIGIWKAFKEMQQLGWLPKSIKLPRMIAVQAANCQPLVETYFGHQENCKNYIGKPTIANGLAVPRPLGEHMMLRVLHESGGTALSITEQEMLEGLQELGKKEGLFVAPEGAAVWMAARKLVEAGKIDRDEKIMLLNTGSGQKYMDNVEGKYNL
ncbi:threonine synthase [Pontibacter cellulosilyticus]|uniref:Threonine synthase n=1 Tax=Pontibacter cellulosilyticus TaxID=1720253 RepID=A0A923N4Q8_9BACT|nr:threonine synthase [Pontibacter cellulosilyticus]MBC5992134.1 threonine synthase [Pontibacter cellulosilyticus]